MIRARIDQVFHKYLKKNQVYQLLDLFEQTQYWSYSDLCEYQLELFRKLWAHCIENVPYYKKIYSETKLNPLDIKKHSDLQAIPFLTKDLIRKYSDELKAANISADRFVRNSTSGSSGSNLYFYSDENIFSVSRALTMRRYHWMNVSIFDKEYIIWGARWDIKKKTLSSMLKGWLKNNTIVSGYNLSDADIMHIYNKMQKINPKIIQSYPSILNKVADIFEANGLHYVPKVIHIGGEKLFDYQREKIEGCFNSKVYDFYGARDMGNIAQNCNKFVGLHVFMENVIVEVVDDEGLPIEKGEGDLVITSLHNYAMPFVRYRIGDRAKISKNNICTCGRNLQLLDEVIGRTFEIIQFPNGNRVGGTFWTLVMRSVPGIKDFQVLQEAADSIIIYYVSDDSNILINIEMLRNNIYLYSGDKLNLEFKSVEKIPITKTGKMQFVISRIK